ncbi:MAG: ATP-binding cassette domain-containing protein [Akkermansiaceae bacterium]|jgi:ABC-type multidrug transport system ATPase subunit
MPQAEYKTETESLWKQRTFAVLRMIPGVGRLRFLRPGFDALLGPLIDAFAAFAIADKRVEDDEVDLILDLLRAAFPEVDHGWLSRRLQRSVRNPQSLPHIAAELHERLDDSGKLALGFQLWTLVDAAGRSSPLRATFDVFMRRLGRPDYGHEILQEMAEDDGHITARSFERVTFGLEGKADVSLPPQAHEHSFRVYRVGDLVMLRNTGDQPLWVRGRSLEGGSFLRMRERQALAVPGWTLQYEDLVHFLNVKKTGLMPRIFIAASDEGITVERSRSRQSLAILRFGLQVEIEVYRSTDLQVGSHESLKPGGTIRADHHTRLVDPDGATVSLEDLRKQAIKAGGRFRIDNKRKRFRVSNDPASIAKGDLLISAGLAPRVVLEMRFVPEESAGYVEVIAAEGSVTINDIPVRGITKLEEGGVIRLSPRQALRCRFSEHLIDEERHVIESLVVEDLIHDFTRDVRALDNLSFTVQRGEMLCIIGPSGSGKSTLLSALSGQLEPTRGGVKLNGVSLYKNREELVRFIAHMAQEEALFPQLTVREHLRHAASIRRPAQSAADRERRIDIVLADLGLQGLSHRRVGSPGEKTLSGGERSRLNLGLDLVSAAEVYLFDEPISGLSSKDSEHVAETLRAMARDKIVICSLHRPGAQVLRLFDKVLLLDSGGRLAYFGTPMEMMEYFRLACQELSIAHTAITGQSALGADFVFDVLETPLNTIGGGQNPLAARRFPPTFWQERFESEMLILSLNRNIDAPASRLTGTATSKDRPFPQRRRRRVREIFSLFTSHFQRSLLSKLRTRGTMYSTLLEAPLLAALIAFTLRSSPEGHYEFHTALHIPAYLFLSVTVAMFLGLTNSATEILRDRPVIRRERNCYPGAGMYVTAKFLALALVAALQCGAYLIVAHSLLEIRGMFLDHWLWMTLTAWTGTSLALLISSVVRTERAALTSVPLLLVPQMLWAGALVPFKEMNRALFNEVGINRDRGGTPVPAQIMPLRYAYESMVVAQATRNPFEKERISLQRNLEKLTSTRELTKEKAERLEVMKICLTKLMAAGCRNASEGLSFAATIAEIARYGDREAAMAIDAWPDGDPKTIHPVSDHFVNARIDLMTREAEAFRVDYRNHKQRAIYLALEQPLLGEKWIQTHRRNGIVLALFIFLCPALATILLRRQNRRVS